MITIREADDFMTCRYITVSVSTLVFYEYIITIHRESQLIYPLKLSLPNIIFYLNRYIPLVTSMLQIYFFFSDTLKDNCRTIFNIIAILIIISVILVEVTLFIRIYGIWEKKQWVFYTMMVVILVAVLGIVYHTWQSLASAQDILKDNPSYYAEAPSCIIISNKHSDLSLVIIHFLYEIVIIFLLNIRVLKYYHWNLYRAGSIMDILHRDGISYFVFILGILNFVYRWTSSLTDFDQVISIFDMALITIKGSPLSNVAIVLQANLHCITCNRLLLRLRNAYHRQMELPIFLGDVSKQTYDSFH